MKWRLQNVFKQTRSSRKKDNVMWMTVGNCKERT